MIYFNVYYELVVSVLGTGHLYYRIFKKCTKRNSGDRAKLVNTEFSIVIFCFDFIP